MSGTKVGLPRHLDGVSHVQPLPRCVGAPQQQVRASSAVDVAQSDSGSPGQDLAGVAPTRDGLGPGEPLGVDTDGRRGPVAGRDDRHRVGVCADACARAWSRAPVVVAVVMVAVIMMNTPGVSIEKYC